MTEILHTNIFFFITSIAVIVFTFLLSLALYHLIKIMRSVRKIMERIEVESEAIVDDVDRLRTYLTEESFLSRFFTSKRHGSEEENEEVPHEQRTRSRKSARKNEPTLRTELRIKNEE